MDTYIKYLDIDILKLKSEVTKVLKLYIIRIENNIERYIV